MSLHVFEKRAASLRERRSASPCSSTCPGVKALEVWVTFISLRGVKAWQIFNVRPLCVHVEAKGGRVSALSVSFMERFKNSGCTPTTCDFLLLSDEPL